jgi:hypothetical protein
MKSYAEELNRRIGQFTKILKKMHRRAQQEIQGPCFAILEEDDPRAARHREKSAAVQLAEELILAGFADAGVDSITCSDRRNEFDLPTEGWGSSDSMSRYVQFAFEEKWFCMDMPLQTLYRDEGETILRSRQGFFYLKDRPEFTLHGEDVDDFDPFRKIYVYGDERSAAEDMAYIWFQLWRFPIDSCLYATAHPFNGQKVRWESGTQVL